MAMVTAGLRWATPIGRATKMAIVTPAHHTAATWPSPTCAPVRTAVATTPVPNRVIRYVPNTSPTSMFRVPRVIGRSLSSAQLG